MPTRRKSPATTPNSSKPKLPFRREISAGGIVWRRRETGESEFVLIQPRGANSWVLPKGHLEQGESAQNAAIREVREETGLEVSSVEPLGDVSYIFSWRDEPGSPLTRIFKRVEFFLMQHAGGNSTAHDQEVDKVEWFATEQAIKRASYANERKLIDKAAARLASL